MISTDKLIGQGNTAEVFLWDADSILKLYRKGIPDSLCEDEFKKTQLAHAVLGFVPAAKKIISGDGQLGAVYQRLYGNTMLKEMMLRPWHYVRYAKQLAECHIALHQPALVGLPSVKDTLVAGIGATALLSEQDKDAIYQYINTLPDGNTICHFDFHPGNIIVSDEKNYVIDWMTACQGDPMADVARTNIILRYSKIPRVPRFVNWILAAFQKGILKHYLNKYMLTVQKSYLDAEKWELPVAAARLMEWIPDEEKKDLLALVRRKLQIITQSTVRLR